jgi:hypothetical protein
VLRWGGLDGGVALNGCRARCEDAVPDQRGNAVLDEREVVAWEVVIGDREERDEALGLVAGSRLTRAIVDVKWVCWGGDRCRMAIPDGATQ